MLYAPKMEYTLISVSKLDIAGYGLTVRNKMCKIYAPNQKLIGTIPLAQGLYKLSESRHEKALTTTNIKLDLMAAHRRLGHIAPQTILQMIAKGSITGLNINPQSKPKFCLACTQGKMSRKPIPKERISERSKTYGHIIHTDLWGPAQVQSLGGKSYYVSYTDDYSRETKIIFLAKKSDTYQSYLDYEAWVEKQRNVPIKALQSNCGGEYLSKAFDQHLKKKGTIRRLTVHDTPEQDGVSERLNRTVVERARSMLFDSQLPKRCWAEAVSHAVWLKNRTSTCALPGNKTPHDMVHGEPPNMSNIRQFGCKAWVLLEAKDQSKLDAKVDEGRFVGYDDESKGY